MQFFTNLNIDFMKWKRHFIIASTAINILGLGLFLWQYLGDRLNVGIDFKGGTEIQVKFAEAVRVGNVRSALESVELRGASVTTIGDPSENEIYIRLPLQAEETQVLLERVKQALRGLTGQAAAPAGQIDLNGADERNIGDFIFDSGQFSLEECRAAASSVTEFKRSRGGMITNPEAIRSLPDANPEILSWLSDRAFLSQFSIRSENSVEGAISKELARKALYAVIGSMFIMLIYIWLRFRFQWGLGAIAALLHDVIVTLGIFCLLGKEWTIPVVASFLTLTGYSVNDTIVVFDRVRENLKKKGAGKLEEVINASINQTLSRTIITSGLTWIVVAALFFLGGEVLNGFAFVLLIGIIVGTYSTIFIASPIIIFWEKVFAGRSTATRARARA